jgi:hypothetical protein
MRSLLLAVLLLAVLLLAVLLLSACASSPSTSAPPPARPATTTARAASSLRVFYDTWLGRVLAQPWDRAGDAHYQDFGYRLARESYLVAEALAPSPTRYERLQLIALLSSGPTEPTPWGQPDARSLSELIVARKVAVEAANDRLRRSLDRAEEELRTGRVASAYEGADQALEAIRWFPYTLDPALEVRAKTLVAHRRGAPGAAERESAKARKR